MKTHTTENAMETGTNYRPLEKGEKVLPTDEYYCSWSGQWDPCGDASGKNFDPALYVPHRRKVEPGYRLLAEGEEIKEGDDIFMGAITGWEKAHGCVGQEVTSSSVRRKIAPEAPQCEPGYRFLGKGDVIEAGDECLDNGTWHPTRLDPGWVLSGACVNQYRRKVASAKVAPGEGYRLLEVGETILDTDEYLTSHRSPEPGKWVKTARTAGKVYTGPATEARPGFLPHRRKVGPVIGEGYRQLTKGEILQSGDEFWWVAKKRWEPATYAGCEVGTSFLYRRKVVTAPECSVARDRGGDTFSGVAFTYTPDACEVEAYPGEIKELRDRNEELRTALEKIRDQASLLSGPAIVIRDLAKAVLS